ncbi:MAG: DUF2752 domain-containing protein [Myxococcota bacterium]|nr:DUF2752 domain-containing protein [Myxococcota bacterium]
MSASDHPIDGTPGASPSEAPGVVVPSPVFSPPHARSKGRRLFDASLPLLILLVFAVVDFPLCPTRIFLGVPCPGCGLTRATLAMLTLDFPAMLRLHPLAPMMAPLVGWALGKPILEELGWIPKHKVFVRVPQPIWIAMAIAFFGLYALRLAGLLGGLPDPVAPADGLLGEAVGLVTHLH